MEIIGKVKRIGSKEKGSSSYGEWTKQNLIIETPGQYTKLVCITNWNDKANLNEVTLGTDIKVEVVTIEAKTSFFDWEHWFFEAVSHRRFANRSYFAFAHPFEAISLIPQDMRYYSELYSVGVIVIGMETSHFELLKNGELSEIDINDVDIQEIYSAPYNHTQPKYQSKFLEALEIRDVRSLYNWGRVRS